MLGDEVVIGLLEPGDPEWEIEIVEISVKRRTIVVFVFAPKDIDPKRFRFELTETVGAAAKVAAEAFGYEAGTPSFQTKDGTVLDRSLSLEAAKVHNREHVELVDAGGGV